MMVAINYGMPNVWANFRAFTFMKKQFGQWSLSFGGVACIICWIVLFSAGLFVDTKPFRDELAKSFDLGDLFRVCLCYTPTNAALLTCLAGLAGGISSRLTYGRFVEDPLGIEATEKLTVADVLVRTENPVASMLRSFIVYFIFVAGLALASPQNPFSEPTQDQYFRFAAMVSVLGFVVGYDPSVFNSLLRKLPWIREQQQEPATVKAGTPAARP
jgi:hypothetical protein